MNPGLVVKLRPSGPWRIGPDSGARNRVDAIYHSDSLYSAVTAAMARLGWLEEWLDATARNGSSAVSFSSCFPYMDEIGFVVPPRTVWPPVSPSAKAARVRWKSARFVPLTVVESILAGRRLDENQWSIDGPSGCLVPADRPGPFRTAVRWSAAVDRLTGASDRHSTACLEFRPGSGLWTVVSFQDEAAAETWSARVKAAFRLLADTGFGGERSRGWGRSEAPEFLDGVLPGLILPAPTPAPAAAPEPAPAPEAASAPPPAALPASAPEAPAAPEPALAPAPEVPAPTPMATPEPPPLPAPEPALASPTTPEPAPEPLPTPESLPAPEASTEPQPASPPTPPPGEVLEASVEAASPVLPLVVEAEPEPEAPTEAAAPQPESALAEPVAVAEPGAPGADVPAVADVAAEPAVAEPAPAAEIAAGPVEPAAVEPAAVAEPAPPAAEVPSVAAIPAEPAPAAEIAAGSTEPAAVAEPAPPAAEVPSVAAVPAEPEPAAEIADGSAEPAAVEPPAVAEPEPPAAEVPAVAAIPAEPPVADSAPAAEIAAGPVEPAAVEPVAVAEPEPPAEAAAAAETPAAEPAPAETVAVAEIPAAPASPAAPTHPHWLLSVFTPAATDTVDWRRGNYTVLARGGRVDSPAGSGELKKQIQMVAEGSVVYAETAPRGSAANVAPDGFAHPVFRAGFALAIPLPEVS